MAGETTITVIGNLVDDPELRFTPSGAPVANFRIASTPRTFDRQSNEWKDGDTLFLSCAVWRQAAENVAESLQRGMRVIVQGRLKSRQYETREGEKRTVFEIDVEEVGPSLRSASAKVTKTTRSGGGGGYSGGGGGGGYSGGGGQQSAPADDPWASPAPSQGGRVAAAGAVSPRAASPGWRRSPRRPTTRGPRPGSTAATTSPRSDVTRPGPSARHSQIHSVPDASGPGSLKGSTTMAKAILRKPKKKVCQFCKEKATGVDYKDTTLLRKFISDRGKIRARRVTGNCVQHQRDVAIAVKNAREVALLPYTSTGR